MATAANAASAPLRSLLSRLTIKGPERSAAGCSELLACAASGGAAAATETAAGGATPPPSCSPSAPLREALDEIRALRLPGAASGKEDVALAHAIERRRAILRGENRRRRRADWGTPQLSLVVSERSKRALPSSCLSVHAQPILARPSDLLPRARAQSPLCAPSQPTNALVTTIRKQARQAEPQQRRRRNRPRRRHQPRPPPPPPISPTRRRAALALARRRLGALRQQQEQQRRQQQQDPQPRSRRRGSRRRA
jgi:hypothetical protein